MNNFLLKINQLKYFLLFIFLFGYAQSIQIRFLVRKEFNWFLFTPEAAIVNFISVGILFIILDYFIIRWSKSENFDFIESIKILLSSILIYLVIVNVTSLLTAIIFNTVERNFNTSSFTHNLFAETLNTLIYSSFFLTYHYYQKNKNSEKKIALHNQALSETKFNQLKTQLNPHFLFNNLNVLDQLIEENKHKASDFLNEFSEIYRYVLDVSEKTVIEIENEMNFASNYFKLMQYKYEDAYVLKIKNTSDMKGFIIPLTLQLLIENAIKHNLGTKSNPVIINLTIEENKITISNNLIEKRNKKQDSGRALKNLKEQYNLLSHKYIEVSHTKEKFTVTIPIIQKQHQ